MTFFKFCFRSGTDNLLLIQIAATFDTFLNDSYTWVSEIKESLSPVKASADKHDIVCIPKTPSQIRAKGTRAAKRRKSSLIPNTAIKTSVHKKANQNTRGTRNSQDQDEVRSTKDKEEHNNEAKYNILYNKTVISTGKSQPKKKIRKTTSKGSSGLLTAITSGCNGKQDVVESPSSVKVTTSRPKKNLLAEFNNAGESLEVKVGAYCSNIDQEEHLKEDDDVKPVQLTDACSQDVSNQERKANNIKKIIEVTDDGKIENCLKKVSNEQIIPSLDSGDLQHPEIEVLHDIPDNDFEVQPPSCISLDVKDVDLEIKKRKSLEDLKEKVESSLVVVAQVTEVDVMLTKTENVSNPMKITEHLEIMVEKSEREGDKETKGKITSLKMETRFSNNPIPVGIRSKVNHPSEIYSSYTTKPPTPKNNVASKVDMFEMQLRSKPKPQLRKKKSLQSKDKGQKIAQFENSTALLGDHLYHSNLANKFTDKFIISSSDLAMLKLQHQQLGNKLQMAFNKELSTNLDRCTTIAKTVKLPPKDDFRSDVTPAIDKCSDLVQTIFPELIVTKSLDENASKQQVAMDILLIDSTEKDHAVNSLDLSIVHAGVEKVVKEIKSHVDEESVMVSKLEESIEDSKSIVPDQIFEELTSISIENTVEELKHVIDDNYEGELDLINHEQKVESFDTDKTLDGMHDENEDNLARISERFVKARGRDYEDDKIDPVCRDSGFASIHSRDIRHSVKSSCFGDRFEVMQENEDSLLDKLIPSSADDDAHLGFYLPGLTAQKDHPPLRDASASSSTLDELVPPAINESVSLNFGEVSRFIGLETYQPSQSFLKLDQSCRNFSILKTSSPENLISNTFTPRPTISSKYKTPFDEQIQTKEYHEKEPSDTQKVIPLGFHSKITKMESFNIDSDDDKDGSSAHSNFMRVPTKEKHRLFAPLTSSPSDLFSNVLSSITMATQKLLPLTTFSANYSPKVMQSQLIETGSNKKFSNFLFSNDIPIKSSKSPVKHNSGNFSDRVFCKSNLKPVFSSNLKTPLKGSLFETSNKINSNVAVVKSSLTLSTTKKFDVPKIEEFEMEKNETVSKVTRSPLISEDKDYESSNNLTKESPVKSLFSSIKDSCKKMFKRSPSPQSKFEDNNKNNKSLSLSPAKTPLQFDCCVVLNKVDMNIVGTPATKEMLPSDEIACASPFKENNSTSSNQTQSSTGIYSTTTPSMQSTDVLGIVGKKSINKIQETKEDDALAILKKNKKKSATLKVGLPWKKKRKSSGHGIKRVSSGFQRLPHIKLHQSDLLDLDEEVDGIVQTYANSGGDSVDNISNTYVANLSPEVPKNLNATYMVISENAKAASPETFPTNEPGSTETRKDLIQSIVDPLLKKHPANSTYLLDDKTFSIDRLSNIAHNVTTSKQEQRRSGVKRRSSLAGLNESRGSALKFMRMSHELVKSICEVDDKTSNVEDSNAPHLMPIIDEGNKLSKDETPKKQVPDSPQGSTHIRGDKFYMSSPTRTATIKDRVKQFFQSGTSNRKTALTSTPSSISLPQRIATQFPDSKRKSKGSTTNSLSKKSTFCSSLFKSRTATKVHKRAGHESETSEGSTTCSTDPKSITSKQQTSNNYPLNYFISKSQTPSVSAAISTEELSKKKFLDKKHKLNEADKRKAEQQQKKAEEVKRKREEKLLLFEQKKKEQEEQAKLQAAAANQKMNERLKASQRILEEKEKGDKEKQKMREKRMLEAEQRRKQEEELKAQALLALEKEKEKQEEAARKQKELETQEKIQRMAEIRKMEELKRMEAEKEKKDKQRAEIERWTPHSAMKSEAERRIEEERKNREIERKLQEHNKKLQSGQLKKGYSSSDLNKRSLRPYNPDNYDIHKIKYGDATDDEDNPRKQIPKWATEPSLSHSIYTQHLNPPDLDAIFDLQFSINLCEAFSKRNPRFFKRTSSAHWDAAPITHNISMYRQ